MYITNLKFVLVNHTESSTYGIKSVTSMFIQHIPVQPRINYIYRTASLHVHV